MFSLQRLAVPRGDGVSFRLMVRVSAAGSASRYGSSPCRTRRRHGRGFAMHAPVSGSGPRCLNGGTAPLSSARFEPGFRFVQVVGK